MPLDTEYEGRHGVEDSRRAARPCTDYHSIGVVTLPTHQPQGQGSPLHHTTQKKKKKSFLQPSKKKTLPAISNYPTTMPRRAPSPTGSEFEFDISTALADNDFLSDDDNTRKGKPNTVANDQNINDILDVSDGDEAFIAAQQAASNRKGSNLKGKTVKKGGGFQQMGLSSFEFWYAGLRR